MTPALRAAYIAAVQKGAAAEYYLTPTPEGFRATSSARLHARFDARTVELGSAGDQATWRWHVEAARWGCEGALAPVETVSAALEVDKNRATYRRRGFDEWYLVGGLGVEQGFTIHAAPACRDGSPARVLIELARQGSLEATALVGGGGASLHDPSSGNVVVRYSDLYVVDARGRELPADVVVHDGAIAIRFDDRGATYPVTVDPLIATEQQKLVPAVATDVADFGASTAVSGDTVIVGAPGFSSSMGAAYVFVRSGASWTEQQKLTAGDGAEGDRFGSSVALSGDTAVVGASGHGDDGQGAAYVFVRSGASWTVQQKLTASTPSASAAFGGAAALTGDTAVIGAPAESGKGAAYVFVRSGTSWSEQQMLTASDGASGHGFARSVAISGETALVGAYGVSANRGAAYAFVRTGTSWTEQQKLTTSDSAPNDFFGFSVALSGDTAVAGAHVKAAATGAAYVFVRSGASWTQQQKLSAPAPFSGDAFGSSVAVSGDAAVIGASGRALHTGAAYLFTRAGTSWPLQQALPASDVAQNDFFGANLSMTANTVVAGVPQKSANLGQAYVFVLQNDKGNGSACSDGTECASGFCADGVCCNTACSAGTCDACSVAAGAPSSGTCALLTGNACDDGSACTRSDTCQAGTCVGGNDVICFALDQCHEVGVCDPATGTCSTPTKINGSACNDDDACTQTDTCQAGRCTGANPVVCAALDACHDIGVCAPASGACSDPTKADGSPCSGGTCQAGTCTEGSADAGATEDAGSTNDAGSINDGGSSTDAGSTADAGSTIDAGASKLDAGASISDAGSTLADSGAGSSGAATGESAGTSESGDGDGCAVTRPGRSRASGGALVFGAIAIAIARRRRPRAEGARPSQRPRASG
ncbi:MAG: FG-GAP repeat protein [Labilithrix sp.]|nr:FG-GAP repeat protein [Labilithrix sp.]